MLYPYPDESRKYTKEISRIFGFMSIFFSWFLPPTGVLMGIVGLYYSKKDAEEHNESYNYTNLGLSSLGVVIGVLMILYYFMFKLTFSK